jgi:AraC-like DNA-binding protein
MVPENFRPAVKDQHRQMLDDASKYIEAHFTRNINIADLANRAGYSRYHFLRLFKAAFGKSPLELVQCLKMEHAKTSLVTTRKSIREIATSLGYTSPTSLHIAFRKVTGMTPRQYRVRHEPPGDKKKCST